MYQRRYFDDLLDQLEEDLPAVLIDGPKGVGKTSTALQRVQTVKRLDEPASKALAEANIDWCTQGDGRILLDEWQRVPQSWDAVKRSVDEKRIAGKFILTGSLPDSSTHSGAGRIVSLRMRPLSLAERIASKPTVSLSLLTSASVNEVSGTTTFGLVDYVNEICRSGFPGIRSGGAKAIALQLNGYVERIIDTDLPELGRAIRKPAQTLAWLRAYAASTGTTTSMEAIRLAASGGHDGPLAKTSIQPIAEALSRLRIIDELEPWLPTQNFLLRLGQSPKRYLADPALTVQLLGLSGESLLNPDGVRNFQGPILGRLFESLVALSLRVYADSNFLKVTHFRETNGRHEVDFIVELEDGKVLAIESKLGSVIRPGDEDNLLWLRGQIGDRLAGMVIVNTGQEAYVTSQGVSVVPLALLGP